MIKKIIKFSFFLKSGLKRRPFPKFSQWRHFFKVLNKKERILFSIFSFFALSSIFFLGLSFYFKNTKIEPAQGGSYIEGIIGQPRFLNPIYASSNDVDRDLVEILFSGLMKYNLKGEIVPDLAQDYKILEEGKIYEFDLKENLFWSDGKEFSVDDIIFTVQIIQNQDYKSPLFPSFLGVEIEKVNEKTIRFKLKDPYPPFLETLTFKVLPKHIWQDISPENFPLADYNLKPIGNGPFLLKELNVDKRGYIKSLRLLPNPYYHQKAPFLSEISFQFFENEADLIKSFQKKEINGVAAIPQKSLENLKDHKIYHFSFPRYFEISFNLEKSKILAEREVRLALNYGTDKKEILREILDNQGKIVHSPLLPEILDFPPPSKIYQFDLKKAKEILEKAGWQDFDQDGKREKIVKREGFSFKSELKLGSRGNEVRRLQECLSQDKEIYPEGEITGFFGKETKEAVIRFQEKYRKDILDPWGFKEGTGIVSKTTREKLNEICGPSEETLALKFSLVTVDEEELSKLADLLKRQWQKLGVELEIKKVNLNSLQKDFIKTRDYEAILFGKVVGIIPDPYSFWHSSQKRDPGLNLANYENKEVDKILEEARQILNERERKGKYKIFQDILIEDSPAIFLYSPDYLYFLPKEIKGIKEGIISDPSKRFLDIENWYIKEKRVWR